MEVPSAHDPVPGHRPRRAAHPPLPAVELPPPVLPATRPRPARGDRAAVAGAGRGLWPVHRPSLPKGGRHGPLHGRVDAHACGRQTHAPQALAVGGPAGPVRGRGRGVRAWFCQLQQPRPGRRCELVPDAGHHAAGPATGRPPPVRSHTPTAASDRGTVQTAGVLLALCAHGHLPLLPCRRQCGRRRHARPGRGPRCCGWSPGATSRPIPRFDGTTGVTSTTSSPIAITPIRSRARTRFVFFCLGMTKKGKKNGQHTGH